MRVRYLVYILPLLLCCCKKSQSGSNTNTSGNLTFITGYDSVINCQANSTYIFSFTVNVTSGNIVTDPLYFSVTGLPANVTDSPSSLRVAQLQGGLFVFNIGNVPAGTDTMHFLTGGGTFSTQSHDLVLNIIPPTNYGALLAGTYDSSYDFCTPDIINYVSVVTAVSDTPSEIKITNIKNLGSGFVVSARITNVVTIPVQTVEGYTIWGTGTYTHDNRPEYDSLYMLAINDTLVYAGSDTQTCTIHIQH